MSLIPVFYELCRNSSWCRRMLAHSFFPPPAIKAEYCSGEKAWRAFLFAELLAAAVSLFMDNFCLFIFPNIFAFSSFRSIGEVLKQRGRVRKCRFPERKKLFLYYSCLLEILNLSEHFYGEQNIFEKFFL
ncbi:MAG: DUF4491 family protein [Bacteroidales bacterium]|nr:DUF4491 family protein [Bacteroidales bacterium]